MQLSGELRRRAKPPVLDRIARTVPVDDMDTIDYETHWCR